MRQYFATINEFFRRGCDLFAVFDFAAHPIAPCGGGRAYPGGIKPVKINAEVFERAQAVIDQLSIEFRDRAQKDLEDLYQEMDLAQTEDSERLEHLDKIRAVLHDMRGQGGTFGLPLITQIAKSLGTYLKTDEAAKDPSLEIAQAHFEAIGHVLAENISDQNSERGRQIIEDLQTSTGMSIEP